MTTKTTNWLDDNFSQDDFAQYDVIEHSTKKVKAKTKLNKRKWREIENIKEQRRFKNELASYEVCSF